MGALRTEFYDSVPEGHDISEIDTKFVEIQERIEVLEELLD